MSKQDSNDANLLDLSNAGRGVWLVKVPKYMANRWEKVDGKL